MSKIDTATLAALAPIAVLTDPAECSAYAAGARGEQGQAAFVMRPGSTEEVARCVQFCLQQGIAFVTQSANTGLVGASVPDHSATQAVLSLERLNQTLQLDRDNRSVRVSAGYRLSALNQALAPEGLCLPIDLASDPMIGGMIATNTGGGRFLRYGDMRQQVLGLSVVLLTPEANVLHLGACARKNNTGPDWKQNFIGSSGQFGVITEAILSVDFAVQQQAAAIVVPRDEQAVLALLHYLERSLGPTLSAFELMSANAMRHALAHAPSLRNGFAQGQIPSMALLVELSRGQPLQPWEQPLETVLEQVLSAAWSLPDEPIVDALFGPPASLWALRHALSEGVKAAGDLIAFDLGFSRQGVLAFRQAMQTALPEAFPGVEIADFGHIGDGGLHFNLLVKKGQRTPSFEQRLRDWVVDKAVGEFGGTYSAEHGIGPKNRRYYQRYSELPAAIAESLGRLYAKRL